MRGTAEEYWFAGRDLQELAGRDLHETIIQPTVEATGPRPASLVAAQSTTGGAVLAASVRAVAASAYGL